MTDKDAEVILLELQAMRREVAGLRMELLRKKAAGTKSAQTRSKTMKSVAKKYPVNDIDIARALKRFRK